MRVSMFLLIGCAVLGAACGDDDAAVAPTTTSTATTTTSTTPTTTTTSTTTTTPDGPALTSCDNTGGFTIGFPASWHADDGCAWFHPEPFELPDATDERVTAVHAHIASVPFAEVATPEESRDAARAVTVVDGLQAVRLRYQSSGQGLYPEDTPITMYAVELAPGVDSGPGTLLLDTIGLPPFDYRRNQAVLDRMARSITVTVGNVPDPAGVVARYEGGGGAFHVVAAARDDQRCLRIPPGGEEQCVPAPEADGIATVTLDNLGPILAGVTGDDVFAVAADQLDGRITFLTVPIADGDGRGFAFAFGPADVDALVALDPEGNELGTIAPN